MKKINRARFRVFILSALLLPAVSIAQTRESGPWWPNAEWGPDDEAGASNRITQEKVLEAIGLVRTGEIYDLGHPYEPEMPFFPGRSYAIESASRAPGRGPNRFANNEEFIAGQLGQVGTQFDGLAHAGREVDMADGTTEAVFYNGFTGSEMDGRYGFAHLGMEHVRPIITRGLLIDLPGYKGIDRLPDGYAVTMEDVQGALDRQGMSESDFGVGDAILFRSGWAQLWDQLDTYYENLPGANAEVVAWVTERKPSIVGSETGGPFGDNAHQQYLTFNGIFVVENMDLERLAVDGVYEFMLIVNPLPLVGATGSPVRPLAIR